MTTVLFVKKFDEDRLTSICKVIETDEPKIYVGQTLRVDLTVNADFDEMPEKELEGKTVVVKSFQPSELIGINVSIKETA